jgi:hypothetical protein
LLLVCASAVILRSESSGTILLSQIQDSLTWRTTSPYLYPPGSRYAASTWSAIRIPPFMLDVLSGLLPRDGKGIIDAGACFCCRGNVFTGCCIAINNVSC